MTPIPVVEQPEIELAIVPIEWTMDKLQEVWDNLKSHEVFSDDGPQTFADFIGYVAPSGLWFELLDRGASMGVISVTHLVASYSERRYISAQFHAALWDSKASPRMTIGREFVRYLFKSLRLHRLEARPPCIHGGAIRVMEKLGFIPETRMRASVRYRGTWVDQLVLSLLEEEV